MKFFKPAELEIKIENLRHNSSMLKMMWNHVVVGHAYYDCSDPDVIYLNWLEVNSDYWKQGIGSHILNYFCNMVKNSEKSLIIKVVDERTLNDFYLKWFMNRFEMQDQDQIIDFFNSLITEENCFLTLKLCPHDLGWKPCQSSIHY